MGVSAPKPKVGDCRYFIDWWDKATAYRLDAERREPDNKSDGLWDLVQQDEIQMRKRAPTKEMAFKAADALAELDIYGMPRVVEETYGLAFDDLGNEVGMDWQETGEWELDGDEVRLIRCGEAV